MSEHPIGVERRIRQLCGDDVTLHGFVKADETEEGYYYVVVRSWDHPDADDAETLSERYAYLTKGGGSDGWVDEGVNRRDRTGGVLAGDLAQLYAQVAANQRGGRDAPEPKKLDATED